MDFLDQIFGPLKTETISNEVEAIQPTEAITTHTRDDVGSLFNTASIIATSPVTIPATVGEVASYNAAKVTGVVPTVFNRVGWGFSRIRTGAKNAREKIRKLIGGGEGTAT